MLSLPDQPAQWDSSVRRISLLCIDASLRGDVGYYSKARRGRRREGKTGLWGWPSGGDDKIVGVTECWDICNANAIALDHFAHVSPQTRIEYSLNLGKVG
jgi:hypothetical protein